MQGVPKFTSVCQEKLIGAHFVDIYFEVNGKKYVVELDGEQHYTVDGKLSSKDKTRDAWLEKQGITVFRYVLTQSKEAIFSDLYQRLDSESSPRFFANSDALTEQVVNSNNSTDSYSMAGYIAKC